MTIDSNEVILNLFHGYDIIHEFKNAYYREPTQEEYDLLKYYAQDKWWTGWITESLQESVWDTITQLEEEGKLPELPPQRRVVMDAVEYLTKIANKHKDLNPTDSPDDIRDTKIYFAVTKALNNLEERFGIRYDRERMQN